MPTLHEVNMTQHSELGTQNGPAPLPSVNITIRPGVMSDIPFLDSLQKLHTKQVGWMPTKQFEGKIALGHVLIAEEIEPQRHGGTEARSNFESASVSPCLRGKSVGYVIGNDQYFKRDDVGIIYQMNVMPGRQRSFVGATLLKAMFDRAAYGCKLFCCWCAQDIAANRFWEAMGFVPLAYRAGGRTSGKGKAMSDEQGPSSRRSSLSTHHSTARVHIFWQKRIRSGDVTTPWWFPSQTTGGSIREDRIVLPIPPGTHWSDAKPLLLPSEAASAEVKVLSAESKTKPTKTKTTQHSAPRTQHCLSAGGLRFAPPTPGKSETVKPNREPKPKTHRVKVKNDPRLVAAARELRDRWLEQVNGGQYQLTGEGKYDVARALPEPRNHANPAPLLLAA